MIINIDPLKTFEKFYYIWCTQSGRFKKYKIKYRGIIFEITNVFQTTK